MKKIYPFTLVVLILIIGYIFSSCNDDDKGAVLSFSSIEKVVKVSCLSETVTIPVISNVGWDVVAPTEEWVEVSKSENGNAVVVKIAENRGSERSSVIKIAGSGVSDNIMITQEILSPKIIINSGVDFVSTNWEEKTLEIGVNSNIKWSLTKTDNWFSTDVEEGVAGESVIKLRFNANTLMPRYSRLIFNIEDETYEFIVQQNTKNTTHESVTNYFYVTFGTMPTLYAGLHALSHDKPSYFAYERVNTFNPEYFPPHIVLSIANGGDDVQEVMRDYMKKKILEVNKANPNAIYGLYVDDLRCRLGYDWFVEQGIDSSRVKVSMLSDGTGTYNEYYNRFGEAGTGETNWKEYERQVQTLNWEQNTVSKSKALPEFFSADWIYYMATIPNYRLLLQDASLLETYDPYVLEESKKMQAVTITPLEMLNDLTADRQATFYEMANFDKQKYSDIFDASPKKNLIIIGTNNSSQQKSLISRTYNKYSEGYDLFYKPHPADPDYTEMETTYPGLKLLPAQMPFEIFVWSLIDKIDVIGGNSSTVLLTVPIEKVKFIYAAGSTSMPKPLDVLYEDATGIEWMK